MAGVLKRVEAEVREASTVPARSAPDFSNDRNVYRSSWPQTNRNMRIAIGNTTHCNYTAYCSSQLATAAGNSNGLQLQEAEVSSVSL